MRGNILGRAELENVFQRSFMLLDKFPEAYGEYGTLRVSGKTTVLALRMCDSPAPGGPKQLFGGNLPTHPIPGDGSPSDEHDDDDPLDPPDDEDDPSGATYIIETFATKLLSQVDEGNYVFAKYAYKVTVKNPTSITLNYGFTVQFRDSDGFAVESVHLPHYAALIPARRTRTFEGTFVVYLPQDPAELTVDVDVTAFP